MPTDPARFQEPSVVKPALHWQKLLTHWALKPHSEEVEQSGASKELGYRGCHLVTQTADDRVYLQMQVS
jgi:hypothetical protein